MDMDLSYTEGDVSLSPSQILDRLHLLRKLQLLQKGKLQKQQLDYHHSPEITPSITEIVSHFSNSTSYNTFRSLLQTSQEAASESSQHLQTNNLAIKENLHNVIEGVTVLNLSEESVCISDTPISSRSTTSAVNSQQLRVLSTDVQNLPKKQILLDDIPILSPKKDFETLIAEKLSDENKNSSSKQKNSTKVTHKNSKPFLRRGEGIARFGLKKKDFVIQNTKALPWRKKDSTTNPNQKSKNIAMEVDLRCNKDPEQVMLYKSKEIISPLSKCDLPPLKLKSDFSKNSINVSEKLQQNKIVCNAVKEAVAPNVEPVSESNLESNKKIPTAKHPLQNNKERTWAAVFTKEQDDFLRQLKQSAYYKNFASPAKSTLSDISYNEQLLNLKHEREKAEQNMFELIENKVSNDSFAMDNSFFNRFIGQNDILECSGESTPLVLKNCIYKNPNLVHIQPDIKQKKKINCSFSDVETCNSEECTECGENCSTVSSCCSCKSVTQNGSSFNHNVITKKDSSKKIHQKDNKELQNCDNDIVTDENEGMSNMADMNAKLIATSELLKDRLKELEDEIETFRKENANLNKMREEVDLERQKFYEEKTAFEQKFNEDKILSEYYLAEEKEKLSKQKQLYERYVRDMRGRLNKKEKDEVANLKKEIYDLKEEIRLKDAKSTSTIARLRNQIKLMDKDKKNLEEEVEKLKKENRRIHHSNEMTRRLTNIKYLEQINKKLSNMASKNIQSNLRVDSDVKYKTFEIERQSRNKKTEPVAKGTKKPRAKSVPNLNVTSRYAKYFSQKNSLSEREMNNPIADNNYHTYKYSSENELSLDSNDINLYDSKDTRNNSDSEEENNLEIIYNERFKSNSPTSKRSSISTSINSPDSANGIIDNCNDFFIRKSGSNSKINSAKTSMSPSYEHLSHSLASNRSNASTSSNRKQDHHLNVNQRSKSPISVQTLSSQNSGTVINKQICSDTRMIPSPEPALTKTSITKTNLNPIEIRKPDGSKELKFPNGNIKLISSDGKYSKFIYYNGDVKENFYNEGRIKYYYAETKTFHTTHPDGLEVLEFPDGHVEKRYKDGSSEIRLPNGSVRYFDPKNEHVREEWRFPDGTALTVSASGEQRIVFPNGQIEVHTKDHKRREFPDGTIKLIYNDGTSETRYSSGRVRIKDKHGNLVMDSAPG